MRSRNLDYIPRLDHLRLLAALLVLAFHFFHYNAGLWQPLPHLAWFGLVTEGHTGVSLFFVLSGFIFMLIALSGEAIRYGEFMRNRCLRILPLFLVVFMLAISIGRDRFEASDIFYVLFTNLGDAPTSWHFATGPAWSISVEFTFYMVFPFLALFVREGGVSYLARLVLLMLVIKTAAYLATPNSTHMLYSTLIGRFDQFLIGMAAAVLYNNHRDFLARRGTLVLVTGAVLTVLAVAAQARFASFFLTGEKQPFWIVWGTLEAMLWASVVVGYLASSFRLPAALDGVLRKGGEWSFSIYMWHALVIFTVHELLGRQGASGAATLLLDGAIVLALTLGVAFLSFGVIEKPFLGLRRRYLSSSASTGK